MDKFNDAYNLDVIHHLYHNKGYRWYVLNRRDSKIFGPFDQIEDTESFTKKDVNCYIQFMDEKTLDSYEYPPGEYIEL